MSALATLSFDAGVSIESLESGEIDLAVFDHDAHVYVAWSYLERHELPVAIDRFSNALIRLTRKIGVPEKYHETITWFFLLLIAERRQTTRGDSWKAFCDSNPDLFGSGSAVFGRHYTHDRLMSPLARRLFLLPDKSTSP